MPFEKGLFLLKSLLWGKSSGCRMTWATWPSNTFCPQVIKSAYGAASPASSSSPLYQFKTTSGQSCRKGGSNSHKQTSSGNKRSLPWDPCNEVRVIELTTQPPWNSHQRLYHAKCLNMKEQEKEQGQAQGNSSDSSSTRTEVTFLYFGEDFAVTSFRVSEGSRDPRYSTLLNCLQCFRSMKGRDLLFFSKHHHGETA